MQRTPVPFAKRMFLEWGNGTREEIQGRYLHSPRAPGMHPDAPAFSDWAMNPLPFKRTPDFEPPCKGEDNDTWCAGAFPWDVSIVDVLAIPTDGSVQPGPHVLQLRWDCEVTAQVWTHCSDIEIA